MGLRSLLIISLIVQQLFTPLSYAADKPKGNPYVEIKSGENARGESIQIKTVIPATHRELDNAIEWASNELTHTEYKRRRVYLTYSGRQAESDVTKTGEEIVQKVSRKTRRSAELEVVKADIPADTIEEIKEETSRIKELFHKHERVTLTILKGAIKSTVSGVALVVAAGVPVHLAVGMALYSGVQSGLFQFFNPKVERFLNGDPAKKERLMNSGRFGPLKVKMLQLSRSFVIGTVVNSTTAIVGSMLGITEGSIMRQGMNVFGATVIGTAARGLWSTAIASETQDGINRNEGNPQEQARWQRRSNIIRFSLSMVTAAGGILTLLGVPMGYWIQGLMTATGLLYTGKHWIARQIRNRKPLQLGGAGCRGVFL